MRMRLLIIGALLPVALQAGVLKLTDGSEIPGVFTHAADTGLRHADAEGKIRDVKPGGFQSLAIDAADAIWPEELRVARTNQFGLLGQYYEGTEFKGEPRVRVDPDLTFRWGSGPPLEGWRSDHFSVRWTGHFQVTETDDYEFATWSDDGVRLFINGKQLIANWSDHSVAENKTNVRLEAAELHEIRVEYFENSGEAELRVEWAGRDRKRRPLGELILVTDGAGVTENRHPAQTPPGLQSGMVLRDGTFLKTLPRRGNDSAFELDQPFTGRTVSAFNVARVVFRDIPAGVAAATRPGRQGALLVGGDFVDSEFQSLESGILQLSSLLFGLQKLDTKFETHALLLREPRPEAARWSVRDRAGSLFLSESLRFTTTGVVISNAVLREVEIPIDTLVSIETAPVEDLFPDSLRFGPDSVHAKEPTGKRSDDADRRRVDSLRRMAAQEKSRRERELSSDASQARSEMATLKEARDKFTDTEAKHAEAHRDFADKQAEHEKLEKDYQSLTAQRTRMESEFTTLSRDQSRVRTSLDQLESRRKGLTTTAKNLERSLDRIRRKNENRDPSSDERRLAETRQQLDGLRSEHARLEKDYAAIHKQRAEKERALTEVRRDLGGRKSSLDRARRNRDSAERQLRYLDGILKQYRSRLAAAEATVAKRQNAQLR